MQTSNYRTKVQFGAEIHGRKKGHVEFVKTDKNGTILDLNIRRRLKDGDGSVIILNDKPNKKETTKLNNENDPKKKGNR